MITITLYVNGQKADNFVIPAPAYNPAHVYTFTLSATGNPLTFGVGDTQTDDNTGAYIVKVYKSVPTRKVTKYYQFGGKRVAMRVDGDMYYLHGDHLGSVSLTTNDGGVKVSDARYYPYGEVRWQEGQSKTDFGFTGQRNEASFGLMDYNARYYSPVLGRFISADSVVPEPGGSQGFNRYSYVGNNPINHTDSSGHCIDAVTGDVKGASGTGSLCSFEFSYLNAVARVRSEEFSRPYIGKRNEGTLGYGDGVGEHPGRDWMGEFDVYAPANGYVTIAMADSTIAGIWRLQNKNKPEEIKEWSGFSTATDAEQKVILDENGNKLPTIPETLLATGEWTDIELGWSHQQGTYTVVDHGGGLKSTFIHLSMESIKEKTGMPVSSNTILGQTALNGRSTSVHLHMEIRFTYLKQTKLIDPDFLTVRQ